jgi:hypothetical protein
LWISAWKSLRIFARLELALATTPSHIRLAGAGRRYRKRLNLLSSADQYAAKMTAVWSGGAKESW